MNFISSGFYLGNQIGYLAILVCADVQQYLEMCKIHHEIDFNTISQEINEFVWQETVEETE